MNADQHWASKPSNQHENEQLISSSLPKDTTKIRANFSLDEVEISLHQCLGSFTLEERCELELKKTQTETLPSKKAVLEDIATEERANTRTEDLISTDLTSKTLLKAVANKYAALLQNKILEKTIANHLVLHGCKNARSASIAAESFALSLHPSIQESFIEEVFVSVLLQMDRTLYGKMKLKSESGFEYGKLDYIWQKASEKEFVEILFAIKQMLVRNSSLTPKSSLHEEIKSCLTPWRRAIQFLANIFSKDRSLRPISFTPSSFSDLATSKKRYFDHGTYLTNLQNASPRLEHYLLLFYVRRANLEQLQFLENLCREKDLSPAFLSALRERVKQFGELPKLNDTIERVKREQSVLENRLRRVEEVIAYRQRGLPRYAPAILNPQLEALRKIRGYDLNDEVKSFLKVCKNYEMNGDNFHHITKFILEHVLVRGWLGLRDNGSVLDTYAIDVFQTLLTFSNDIYLDKITKEQIFDLANRLCDRKKMLHSDRTKVFNLLNSSWGRDEPYQTLEKAQEERSALLEAVRIRISRLDSLKEEFNNLAASLEKSSTA